MAKPQDFTIKESLVELKELRKNQKSFKHEKRILWLVYLKENKFRTRVELCEYLGITPRTQQRWARQYREKGIGHLLADLPKKRRSKTITPEIHKALEQRLRSGDKGFLGYWEARQWVNEKFGTNIQYHWLRKYLITYFGTKLKSPRKSHYRKDDEAEKAFLKTSL